LSKFLQRKNLAQLQQIFAIQISIPVGLTLFFCKLCQPIAVSEQAVRKGFNPPFRTACYMYILMWFFERYCFQNIYSGSPN